jgi:hypothetical protein
MDPALAATLRAALAALFLAAVAHKLRDRRRFGATLADYQVLPGALVGPAALGVVTAELAIVGMLVAPGLSRAGAASAGALLVVYGAAIGVNLARGRRHIDCGCMAAAARRPISGWLVVRNLVLVAVALAGLLPVRSRPFLWIDAVTVAGATMVLAALYTSIERLLAEAPRLASLRSGA